jgi:AcrR family transcriptional regulator
VVARSLEEATSRSLLRAASVIEAPRARRRQATDDVTLPEVADRAGQSLRTFYQHFGSKNDLLLAVFEEEVEEYARALRAEIETQESAIDQLRAFLRAGISAVDPIAAQAVALTRYRLRLTQTSPEDVARVQAPVVALAQEVISRAMEADDLPALDPEPLAYMVVTAKSSYLHSMILGNELGVELPSAHELVRFCLLGLGADPAALPAVDASD